MANNTSKTNDTNETILNVPLTSVAVDLAWHARSGARKRDSGFEAESAFEELKESIRTCGVKDPVKVRPVAGGERPFALVSGFRRYGACEELGLEAIAALVREMSDTEARLENARENAQWHDTSRPPIFQKTSRARPRRRLPPDVLPASKTLSARDKLRDSAHTRKTRSQLSLTPRFHFSCAGAIRPMYHEVFSTIRVTIAA